MKFKGLVCMAGMHKRFPVSKALEIVRVSSHPGIAILWGTFGKERALLKEFMNEHPDGYVQIYFSNEVGRRNGKMFEGELFRRSSVFSYNQKLQKMGGITKARIQSRVYAIKAALQKYQKRHSFMLCLGLEDQFTNAAVRNLIAIIREVWPYDISRNPVSPTNAITVYGDQHVNAIELHGDRVTFPTGVQGIYTNDGYDVDFDSRRTISNEISPSTLSSELKRHYINGNIGLCWFASSQGLTRDSWLSAPPRKRDFRISDEQVLVVSNVLKGE